MELSHTAVVTQATAAFWGALPVTHATIAYAASALQCITMLDLYLGSWGSTQRLG